MWTLHPVYPPEQLRWALQEGDSRGPPACHRKLRVRTRLTKIFAWLTVILSAGSSRHLHTLRVRSSRFLPNYRVSDASSDQAPQYKTGHSIVLGFVAAAWVFVALNV